MLPIKMMLEKLQRPFRIRLKPNAQLLTQRPSKVPIHYRDELNSLLKELENHNIIKQIGSSPQDKPVYGTTYLNPLIIVPKGDSIKCVTKLNRLTRNTVPTVIEQTILSLLVPKNNEMMKTDVMLMQD